VRLESFISTTDLHGALVAWLQSEGLDDLLRRWLVLRFEEWL